MKAQEVWTCRNALALMTVCMFASSLLHAQSTLNVSEGELFDSVHYYLVQADHGEGPTVANLTASIDVLVDTGQSARARLLDISGLMEDPTAPDVEDRLVSQTITDSGNIELTYASEPASGLRQYILEVEGVMADLSLTGSISDPALTLTLLEEEHEAGDEFTLQIGSIARMRSRFTELNQSFNYVRYVMEIDQGVSARAIRYVASLLASNVSSISFSANQQNIRAFAIDGPVDTLDEALESAVAQRLGPAPYPGYGSTFYNIETLPASLSAFDEIRAFESDSFHTGTIDFSVQVNTFSNQGSADIIMIFDTDQPIVALSDVLDTGPLSTRIGSASGCAVSDSAKGSWWLLLFALAAGTCIALRTARRAKGNPA